MTEPKIWLYQSKCDVCKLKFLTVPYRTHMKNGVHKRKVRLYVKSFYQKKYGYRTPFGSPFNSNELESNKMESELKNSNK